MMRAMALFVIVVIISQVFLFQMVVAAVNKKPSVSTVKVAVVKPADVLIAGNAAQTNYADGAEVFVKVGQTKTTILRLEGYVHGVRLTVKAEAMP